MGQHDFVSPLKPVAVIVLKQPSWAQLFVLEWDWKSSDLMNFINCSNPPAFKANMKDYVEALWI